MVPVVEVVYTSTVVADRMIAITAAMRLFISDVVR